MLTIKMLTLTLCYVKFCLSKPNNKITNGGGHRISLGGLESGDYVRA